MQYKSYSYLYQTIWWRDMYGVNSNPCFPKFWVGRKAFLCILIFVRSPSILLWKEGLSPCDRPPKIIYFKFRLKRAWNYAYLASKIHDFLRQRGMYIHINFGRKGTEIVHLWFPQIHILLPKLHISVNLDQKGRSKMLNIHRVKKILNLWKKNVLVPSDASFQEISRFQDILQEMSWLSWFQELLLCTKE